jgi:hypothetical protein
MSDLPTAADPCHGLVNHGNYQKCPVTAADSERDELRQQIENIVGWTETASKQGDMACNFTVKQTEDMLSLIDAYLDHKLDAAISGLPEKVDGKGFGQRNRIIDIAKQSILSQKSRFNVNHKSFNVNKNVK